MRRVLLLTRWALREPALWRVALLLFLVLLFSLTSGVIRTTGGGTPGVTTPEESLESVLEFTAGRVVSTAYPFVFPLISILVTLAIVVQRDAGGLAAFQAQGFRRWEILLAQSLAIFLLALLPALMAFLALPPIVEPAIASPLHLAALYPLEYWAAMPRLFLAMLFVVLFASTVAMVIRRAAVALGAMVTFFFVGWYLQSQLGTYSILTPPGAFRFAYYRSVGSLAGIPIPSQAIFLLYMLAAISAFLIAILYASRWGEL